MKEGKKRKKVGVKNEKKDEKRNRKEKKEEKKKEKKEERKQSQKDYMVSGSLCPTSFSNVESYVSSNGAAAS